MIDCLVTALPPIMSPMTLTLYLGQNPGGWSGLKKMLIAGHYPFYLSLENTIMDGYVTEKFYEGFLTDTVMVYLGAPDAHCYAPAPHSFINIHDFEGPQQLALFLKELAADRARYESYQAWKKVPGKLKVASQFATSMNFDLLHQDQRSFLCRLCMIAASGTVDSSQYQNCKPNCN